MKFKKHLTKIAIISVSALMLLGVGNSAVSANHVKTQNPRVECHFKQVKEIAAEKKNDRRYHIQPNERHGRNYIKQYRRYIRRQNHAKYIRQNNIDHRLTKPQLVYKIVMSDIANLEQKFNNAKSKINYRHQSRNFKRGFYDGEWNLVTEHLIKNREYKRGYIDASAFSVSPHNHVTKRTLNDARNSYRVIEKTKQIFSYPVVKQINEDALDEVYYPNSTK